MNLVVKKKEVEAEVKGLSYKSSNNHDENKIENENEKLNRKIQLPIEELSSYNMINNDDDTSIQKSSIIDTQKETIDYKRNHISFINPFINLSESQLGFNEESSTPVIPKKIVLSWRSISAYTKSSCLNRKILKNENSKVKIILENVNGIVRPGEMLALIGSRYKNF